MLAETRRLSDAVLIGAGTLRAERYTPMRGRTDARPERESLGLAPAPVLAVVSGSLDLPWDEPVFSEYVAARGRTGEPVASLTLEKFRAKLEANNISPKGTRLRERIWTEFKSA